jgi:Protein of unknown function (DUF3667)
MSDAVPASHCANCGHRLAPWDHFCSQCGQRAVQHAPTLWEFVHEWVLHYLAFEGALWRSLWGLMARPGYLTLEYLAGRRQRYVLPLRLLLTLGLLFFFALKLLPGSSTGLDAMEREMLGQRAPAAAASAASASEPETYTAIHLPAEMMAKLPASTRESIERLNERTAKEPADTLRRIGSQMLSLAPYMVLLSLPFFAGLLKLLVWRQPYGLHFVFAMHLHAAWYGLLLILVLLPLPGVGVAVWLWSNYYPLRALKRVYGGGWGRTLARGAVLALFHWVLIVLLLVALTLWGALAAA